MSDSSVHTYDEIQRKEYLLTRQTLKEWIVSLEVNTYKRMQLALTSMNNKLDLLAINH